MTSAQRHTASADPARHSPRQRRSERTEARIVAAALALVQRAPLSELSVVDIARRARVSVGGFYRRFPSKDALSVYMAMEALAKDLIARLERELSDDRVAGLSLVEILEIYYAGGAEAFLKHRDVLSVAVAVARDQPDSALAEQVRDFNQRVHGRLRALALARTNEITHPEPERAFDLGLLTMSAALREIILYGQPVSTLAVGDIPTIVRDLAAAHYAMLTPALRPPLRSARRARR